MPPTRRSWAVASMLRAQLGPVQESPCWGKRRWVITCIHWIFWDERWSFCPTEV